VSLAKIRLKPVIAQQCYGLEQFCQRFQKRLTRLTVMWCWF